MNLETKLTIKSTHRQVRLSGWDTQSSRHNGNCKAQSLPYVAIQNQTLSHDTTDPGNVSYIARLQRCYPVFNALDYKSLGLVTLRAALLGFLSLLLGRKKRG